MNSAVTCAKRGLYVIASMELQVHESNLRPVGLKRIFTVVLSSLSNVSKIGNRLAKSTLSEPMPIK